MAQKINVGKLFAYNIAVKPGFTLIELLVVIGIISILSMIAFPNLVRMKEIYVVKGEMQRIISFISLAKSAALNQNDQVGIQFPPGTGSTLTMFVDSNRNRTIDAGERVIHTMKLDSALEIEKTTATNNIIATNPTGLYLSPGSYGSIGFKYNNQYRTIAVSTVGRINITRTKLP